MVLLILKNMIRFIYEGEVESLTPRQLEFVSEVLEGRGFKNNKVVIETLGKAGDNYIAIVKKITVKVDDGTTFNIIAKVAPTNELARALSGTTILFGNECVMYNEVLPKFQELQKTAGLSEDEYFRYPKCYGTLMEPLNEIILLEDLTVSHFEMLDRFTPLTNESVKLILKNFAILHSISFVLKKRYPETFESYNEKFGDLFLLMSSTPEFQSYLSSLEADVISVLDKEQYKKSVRGTVSQLSELCANIFKYERNMNYSVIIHGDGWTNNVMFRLKENIPVEAILIDYQVSKVSNPVSDILYMIFNCTDHLTRHNYYYEWIDYYHSELDKSLDNFSMKANYVYPRDKLDADLRRYSKVFFATAISLSSVLIRKTEDAAKVREAMNSSDQMKELTEALKTSNLDSESVALFKRRVEDLVDSYKEFGYIDK